MIVYLQSISCESFLSKHRRLIRRYFIFICNHADVNIHPRAHRCRRSITYRPQEHTTAAPCPRTSGLFHSPLSEWIATGTRQGIWGVPFNIIDMANLSQVATVLCLAFVSYRRSITSLQRKILKRSINPIKSWTYSYLLHAQSGLKMPQNESLVMMRI